MAKLTKYGSDRSWKGQSKLMTQNARKSNKKMRPDGFIYIVQFGNEDIFKIGVSANPERRIKDIDSYSPFPIKKICSYWFKNVYEMEECIHDNFSKNKIRKEWFRIDRDLILDIAKHLQDISKQGFYLIPVKQ